MHVFQISCDTQKWRIRVYTIRVLTTLGWDKLPVYLSRPGTCLPLDSRDVGIWLTSVSLTPARGWTFTTRALKGSHQVPWGNAQSFLEEPAPPPDFWEGPLWQKENPHCLHPFWTAVTSIIYFTEMFSAWQVVPNWAMWSTEKENTVCIYSDLFATKPSCKMNAPENTPRETLF